jgi:hypothetical protein
VDGGLQARKRCFIANAYFIKRGDMPMEMQSHKALPEMLEHFIKDPKLKHIETKGIADLDYSSPDCQILMKEYIDLIYQIIDVYEKKLWQS